MKIDKAYSEHPVFEQISKFAKFYESLAFSVMSFVSMDTGSFVNIDTYVFSSMQGTLESIKSKTGRTLVSKKVTVTLLPALHFGSASQK